ncbi:PiggyBac transposable element-derived protein 1 [Stylophora pistillata]|uniref:PiggyBac transposable element-derived protein 1 n=1 Tax=Stylophora pistillata TaxID=50429 RepID=A0A2B4R2Y5_STYPI|nr:PiggyBac transposable element-derived protein 1 [Stylophora pistillata]
MAGKGRVVYYSTEETLRAVLEGQSDESELEVSDSSDVESDHLSHPSDHSDTESAPTLPNDENARNQVDVPPEPQNEPRRGRGRGRGAGRNRGQARGRGQPVQVAEGEEDIAQDVLIAKNGTVWQTTPPNRAKYGIKIWWCCDSQTCYPLNGEVYLGRQPGQQREVGQGARVVKQLVAPWRRSGRNVTADNFFTSIPLAEDLLKDGLTYVGTIRSNKPHIPDAMKANSTRQVNSSLFGFNDQATLVSYVPKVKQAVLALSTMHHDDQVDGDAQKPEIILYYNSAKSGVDNLDHLATMYTCRRKVNRWPVALFGNVVDVGAVAAFIIWMGNFPPWKISEGKRRRRLFLSELANQLVMPHIRRRALTPTLQAPIRNAMKMVGVDLPPPVQQAQALTSAGKRKRCHLCPRAIDKKVRLACDRKADARVKMERPADVPAVHIHSQWRVDLDPLAERYLRKDQRHCFQSTSISARVTQKRNDPKRCVQGWVWLFTDAAGSTNDISKHNDTRDLAAAFLSTVYSDSEVDPELQDISGEQLKRGADKTKGITLNLHPRGFCEQQRSAFPDVRVCHPNVESYKNIEPQHIYRMH